MLHRSQTPHRTTVTQFSQDIQHVVPLSHYITDSEFCRYMTRNNDTIGDNQLYNLRKLKHYVRNPGLRVTNQNVSYLYIVSLVSYLAS